MELKPCPFCGIFPVYDKVIAQDKEDRYYLKHHCKLLHTSIKTFYHKAKNKITERWNTRIE